MVEDWYDVWAGMVESDYIYPSVPHGYRMEDTMPVGAA